jgi:cobalamin synthase
MFVFTRFLAILSLSVQGLRDANDHFVPPSQADATAMEDVHLGWFGSLVACVCDIVAVALLSTLEETMAVGRWQL